MEALYSFQLLDNLYDERRKIVSEGILCSYLAYRVKREPKIGNPVLNFIRMVAEEAYQNQDIVNPDYSSVEAIIEALCSSLARTRYGDPSTRFNRIFHWNEEVSGDEYKKSFLAAAIITNNLSLLRKSAAAAPQLLSDLWSDTLVFGRFLDLAATYGNKAVLECLMTFGVSTVRKDLRTNLFVEAARRGRADIVRFLYDFKREVVPWDFTESEGLYQARDTPCIDVLKFVEEIRPLYPIRYISPIKAEPKLWKCAHAGRLDTTLHLINLGAHPQGITEMGSPRDNSPIRVASTMGHVAIVELLLSHGADRNVAITSASKRGRTEIVRRLANGVAPPVGALSIAAAGGCLEIVQLLLDAGADPNETVGLKSPLGSAILKEHTTMFKVLIANGANLSSKGMEEVIQKAKNDGLESMLQLLPSYDLRTTD